MNVYELPQHAPANSSPVDMKSLEEWVEKGKGKRHAIMLAVDEKTDEVYLTTLFKGKDDPDAKKYIDGISNFEFAIAYAIYFHPWLLDEHYILDEVITQINEDYIKTQEQKKNGKTKK